MVGADTKRRKNVSVLVAFLIGALLATLVTLYLTGDYTRRLEADLEWAVQRGIRNEAMLILCRQQQGK